jgi:hypothetical protein
MNNVPRTPSEFSMTWRRTVERGANESGASAVAVDDAEEEGHLVARHQVFENVVARRLGDHAVQRHACRRRSGVDEGGIRLDAETIDEHVGLDVTEPDVTEPESLARTFIPARDFLQGQGPAGIFLEAVADGGRDEGAVNVDVDDSGHHPARPALHFE